MIYDLRGGVASLKNIMPVCKGLVSAAEEKGRRKPPLRVVRLKAGVANYNNCVIYYQLLIQPNGIFSGIFFSN